MRDGKSPAGASFQSTLPVGGATYTDIMPRELVQFQSTLPVGGATGVGRKDFETRCISIHAPRGGSDAKVAAGQLDKLYNFNPRSPWGERLYGYLSNKWYI